MTVGGRVAGVLGMLLGVPLMASVYKLVREDIRARQEKKGPVAAPLQDGPDLSDPPQAAAEK